MARSAYVPPPWRWRERLGDLHQPRLHGGHCPHDSTSGSAPTHRRRRPCRRCRRRRGIRPPPARCRGRRSSVGQRHVEAAGRQTGWRLQKGRLQRAVRRGPPHHETSSARVLPISTSWTLARRRRRHRDDRRARRLRRPQPSNHGAPGPERAPPTPASRRCPRGSDCSLGEGAPACRIPIPSLRWRTGRAARAAAGGQRSRPSIGSSSAFSSPKRYSSGPSTMEIDKSPSNPAPPSSRAARRRLAASTPNERLTPTKAIEASTQKAAMARPSTMR